MTSQAPGFSCCGGWSLWGPVDATLESAFGWVIVTFNATGQSLGLLSIFSTMGFCGKRAILPWLGHTTSPCRPRPGMGGGLRHCWGNRNWQNPHEAHSARISRQSRHGHSTSKVHLLEHRRDRLVRAPISYFTSQTPAAAELEAMHSFRSSTQVAEVKSSQGGLQQKGGLGK